MEGHTIQPGSVLAGRYRIDDLVGEAAGSTTWRAFDQILNRSVSIRALPADDPRCEAFLDAARRSTAVSDPRFLPVLDAVPDEDGIAYVVREWSRGVPLSVLLREGPLPSRRAAEIVGEVADALAHAHEVGMPHRAINPSTIVIKDTGAVRITGLGTEHALRAATPAPDLDVDQPDPDAADRQAGEQADVRALGRILYACLVARWPGGRGYGLPPAPTEHGRLLRPRQVRAGVARDADRVCDRILGQPPRHHEPPLTTAREIAEALALVEDEDSLLDTEVTMGGQAAYGNVAMLPVAGRGGPGGPPPAILPNRPRPAPKSAQPSRLQRSKEMARQATEGHRKLIWLALALAVALSAVVAFVIGRQTVNENTPVAEEGFAASGPPVSGTEINVIKPKAVLDFDPQGDPPYDENPEDVQLAIDGKPATAWKTNWYTSPDLGNLKNGVGLIVDLGKEQPITDVQVQFGAAPTSYQLWVAPPGTSEPPTEVPPAAPEIDSDAWHWAGGREGVESSSQYRLTRPETTRYVLVWMTSLPPDGNGTYTGVIKEITIKGPAS